VHSRGACRAAPLAAVRVTGHDFPHGAVDGAPRNGRVGLKRTLRPTLSQRVATTPTRHPDRRRWSCSTAPDAFALADAGAAARQNSIEPGALRPRVYAGAPPTICCTGGGSELLRVASGGPEKNAGAGRGSRPRRRRRRPRSGD